MRDGCGKKNFAFQWHLAKRDLIDFPFTIMETGGERPNTSMIRKNRICEGARIRTHDAQDFTLTVLVMRRMLFLIIASFETHMANFVIGSKHT